MCGKNITRQHHEFRTAFPVCGKECLSKRRSQFNSKEIIIKPCEICGKPVKKKFYRKDKGTCCSQNCNKKYCSLHLSELNKKLNPIRMITETREKLRSAHLGKGEGKTYTKFYGQHEHRVVAENKIGRKLLPGEIVHHIDENKKNNHPDNIQIFSSQAEHAKHHMLKRQNKK